MKSTQQAEFQLKGMQTIQSLLQPRKTGSSEYALSVGDTNKAALLAAQQSMIGQKCHNKKLVGTTKLTHSAPCLK